MILEKSRTNKANYISRNKRYSSRINAIKSIRAALDNDNLEMLNTLWNEQYFLSIKITY